MTLFDCRVPYVALPEEVLKLHTKSDLLHAIELYRSQTVEEPSPQRVNHRFVSMTAYQRRRRADALSNLERAGVILEVGEQDGFELLPLEGAKGRIVIPAEFDYSKLSLVALKTLLVCHHYARYSRTPFRFSRTQAELAEGAGIAERRLRDALPELELHHFLRVRKVWRAGSEITLHEPNSDVPYYYLGEYHRQRLNAVEVPARYGYLLGRYDPKGKLNDSIGPVRSYAVFCPFCRSHKGGKLTFRFTCTDDEDHWVCFNCRRSGDSDRLWAKLSNWREQSDWRAIIADACPTSVVDLEMIGDQHELATEDVNQGETMSNEKRTTEAPDFGVLTAEAPNDVRDLVTRLLENGTVTETTTFGELQEIFAAEVGCQLQ